MDERTEESLPSADKPGQTSKLPEKMPPNESLRKEIQAAVSGIVVNPQQSSKVTEKVISVMTASESFRGPMPHPRHLAEYENICPGAADRIIKLAETALARSEDRKDKLIDLDYGDRRRGMNYGFLALIAVLLTGLGCLGLGHENIGGALLASSIIGAAVSPFVNGRASLSIGQKKETSTAPAAKTLAKGVRPKRR